MGRSRTTRRWCFITDTHGHLVEQKLLDSALEFLDKEWKPDVRIAGGDHLDLGPLRRGASREERTRGLRADFDACIDFFQRYQPSVWLRGNHDERIIDIIQDPPDSQAWVAELFEDKLAAVRAALPRRVREIPYDIDNGFKLGDTTFIHGYGSSVPNATMQAATDHGNVVHGHNHANCAVPVAGAVGYGVGCLCRIEQRYNRASRSRLRHCHGFAYGTCERGRCTVNLRPVS